MRRYGLGFLLALAALVTAPALAHEGHVHGPGPVVVVEIEGPMDQRVIDFAVSTLDDPDAQVFVLLVNSPGVASGKIEELAGALDAAAAPVAMWVGPQDAVAYGGVAQLLQFVDFAGAAPGASIGYATPTVAGDAASPTLALTGSLAALTDATAEVDEAGSRPDFLDTVTPSIGQFIAALDGLTIDDVELETVDQTTLADGSVVTVPSVEVRFVKPGLFARFLRLSIQPEAAFFFLVAGVALIAFEFYAAGVGVTAGVAVLSLFLSAYGLTVLPVRLWSLALIGAAMFLLTWDFQRNRFGVLSAGGLAGLLLGGLFLTDAAPQFSPQWWVVALVVIGIGLWYYFAMTTVVRARFSTPTIGREHLIGRVGVAETAFDPDGVVSVDGARWRATAHRAAGIAKGDRVAVLAVDEVVLEVQPLEEPANGEVS